MTLVNEYRAPRIIRETFIKSFVKIKIVLNLNGRKNDSEINYSAPYFCNAVSGRDGWCIKQSWRQHLGTNFRKTRLASRQCQSWLNNRIVQWCFQYAHSKWYSPKVSTLRPRVKRSNAFRRGYLRNDYSPDKIVWGKRYTWCTWGVKAIHNWSEHLRKNVLTIFAQTVDS